MDSIAYTSQWAALPPSKLTLRMGGNLNRHLIHVWFLGPA